MAEAQETRMTDKRLEGFLVLVAGGAGTVGRGIVLSLIDQGAQVVVPARSSDSFAQLKSRIDSSKTDRLHLIVGDLSSHDAARTLRDEVTKEWGTPSAIVASIGGGAPAPSKIQEMQAETLESSLDENLVPHFMTLRTFFPLLVGTQGSSYTIIAGAAGESAWSGYGAMNIPSAALLMMAQVLSQDAATTAVRTNTIVINGHIANGSAESSEMTVQPRDIGSLAAWLVSPESNMLTGNVLHVNPRKA